SLEKSAQYSAPWQYPFIFSSQMTASLFVMAFALRVPLGNNNRERSHCWAGSKYFHICFFRPPIRHFAVYHIPVQLKLRLALILTFPLVLIISTPQPLTDTLPTPR